MGDENQEKGTTDTEVKTPGGTEVSEKSPAPEQGNGDDGESKPDSE